MSALSLLKDSLFHMQNPLNPAVVLKVPLQSLPSTPYEEVNVYRLSVFMHFQGVRATFEARIEVLVPWVKKWPQVAKHELVWQLYTLHYISTSRF